MKKVLWKFFLGSLSSIFLCCNNISKIKKENFTLNVKIDIHSSKYGYWGRVVLQDSTGKDIDDKKILVKINEIELPLTIGVGNYYDRYPSYKVDFKEHEQLAKDSTYKFSMIYTDGKEYELVTVTPKFYYPTVQTSSLTPQSKEIEIRIENINKNISNTLQVFTSANKQEGNVIENSGDKLVDTLLTSTSAKFHLPLNIPSEYKLDFVSLKLEMVEERVNIVKPKFLKTSIQLHNTIEKVIEIQ